MPGWGKQLFGALKADPFVAVIYRPGSKAEIASFQSSLSLYTVILSSVSIAFDSFQPTANKLAHIWVDILGLFLFG